MPLQSNLWFAAVDPDAVPKPSPGYYALFISNGQRATAAGFVHKKDATGEVSTAVQAPEAYSDERVRDSIGAILTDTATIDLVYNDAADTMTAAIVPGSVLEMYLADAAVTTAKLADGSVTTAKLTPNVVTAVELADAAVDTAAVADLAITGGKLADLTVTNGKIADGAVSRTKLEDGIIDPTKLADGAVTANKIAGGAVGTPALAGLAVGTVNLKDSAVTTAKILDANVTAAKIGPAAVGTAAVADGAVTGLKLAAGAVGTTALADASVTALKLGLNAVGTTAIADGAVTTAKHLDASVTNAKLAAAAVNTTNIVDASVTNAKLAPSAVSTATIADGSITAAKLGLDAVTNAKIADAAVGTAELADLSVSTVKLAADAVTNAKMADLSVGTAELIDASVTGAKLATDAVTQVKIADAAVGTAELVDGSVTAAKLGTDSVTNIKIADAAVGTAEIADLSVTTGKLADAAVTTAKLAANAVTTATITDANVTGAKLATDAVTQIKIADAAVGTAELIDGSVTNAKLGTDAVTNAKIADAAVNTAEIVDAAVTNLKLSTMAAATFKMRAAGAGIGAPIDGTATQAKAALAITSADVSGLGTAATANTTAFEPAGAAAAAQAAAIAASQPVDADLTAIAALATTAYGRALLTLTDAAADTANLNVATQALKGLMSAADKSKLDSVSVISNKLRFTVTDNGILTSNTGAANVTAWNSLMGTIPDNSEVYFPPGPNAFPFASTLVIPAGKHLKVAGASNQKSIIQIQSATADFFQVGDWYNEFDGLKFTTSVTRTGGAAINSGNNVAMNVYNCDFAGMYDGILYSGGINAGNLAVVSNCNFTETRNRGIVIDGTNANTILEKVVMDGTAGQQVSGLELLQAGSVLVSNCDFIRAQSNLRITPVSPNGVFSAYFINTFFDTSSGSSVRFQGTGNIQRVKFTNCWFSGSVIGCEFASTAATLPTAIDFIGCDIFGNSGRGIYANGVQDFSVSNSRIAGNTIAGIEANASAGSVTKFTLSNNSIGPTAGFGANGTGILINAGTFGGYAIKNNDVRGNTTNNITDNGSVATTDLKIIGDNIGHLIIGSIGNLAAPVNAATLGALTALLTVRVPAKAANAGQVFRFRAHGLSNSTGMVAFRVLVGATGTTSDAVAWTSITSAAQAANQRAGFDGMLTVRTSGATGTVQAEAQGFAHTALLPTTVAAVTTPTVNTTTPWFITLAVTVTTLGSYTAHQAVVEAL
jgi:hypothetical protein